MTTHILEIAERICDRVGIISKGRLIAVGDAFGITAEKNGNSIHNPLMPTSKRKTLEDIFLDLTADA